MNENSISGIIVGHNMGVKELRDFLSGLINSGLPPDTPVCWSSDVLFSAISDANKTHGIRAVSVVEHETAEQVHLYGDIM